MELFVQACFRPCLVKEVIFRICICLFKDKICQLFTFFPQKSSFFAISALNGNDMDLNGKTISFMQVLQLGSWKRRLIFWVETHLAHFLNKFKQVQWKWQHVFNDMLLNIIYELSAFTDPGGCRDSGRKWLPLFFISICWSRILDNQAESLFLGFSKEDLFYFL